MAERILFCGSYGVVLGTIEAVHVDLEQDACLRGIAILGQAREIGGRIRRQWENFIPESQETCENEDEEMSQRGHRSGHRDDVIFWSVSLWNYQNVPGRQVLEKNTLFR